VNIARGVSYEAVFKKIESYRVTHDCVIPVIPLRGGAARYPRAETLPLQGKGYMLLERSLHILSSNYQIVELDLEIREES